MTLFPAIRASLLACALSAAVRAETPFVHPGLLQSAGDLARIKAAVSAHKEPIWSGFQALQKDPASQASYRMKGPFPEIGRNPDVHALEFDSDAAAAYQCALLWCITGDRGYEQTAARIVDAWSDALHGMSGADAALMAGLGPFKLVNAAELLRHSNSGWSQAEADQCGNLLRTVIHPQLADFAPFAEGDWGAAACRTMLAIAVYSDDRALFDEALRYYAGGSGNGSLARYVYVTGQCQESGRDQPHAQLGLGRLGDACEIAWNQGLDLFGLDNGRLLRGFEYTAAYNLGQQLGFGTNVDRTGKYPYLTISPAGRGKLLPIYEQIYNHYSVREGLPAPWTQRAAATLRPEGAADPAAGEMGFGTLLYSQSGPPPTAPAVPAAPAGLVARGAAAGVYLSWIAPVGAQSYSVLRAETAGGPYAVVAPGISGSPFSDSSVEAGHLYFYTVSAAGTGGPGPGSQPIGIGAGLPPPWKHENIGSADPHGDTQWDGSCLTVEGVGANIASDCDHCHFAFFPLHGGASITARFLPDVSSQASRFGIMIRSTLAVASAEVALLLEPSPSGDGWFMMLIDRTDNGPEPATVAAKFPLPAPLAANGHLLIPCWFRLTRSGSLFAASVSADGSTWYGAGQTRAVLPASVSAGFAASSGDERLSTTAKFDNIVVTPLTPAATQRP